MKPDFGEIIARGIVDGVVGVLSQPLVIIALVVVIGVSILTRRRRRR
jgi:flagellar biosynthesis protein FliQ